MKNSPFRIWCTEMWFKHQDECQNWGQTSEFARASDYLRVYRFWLKREYRHQLARQSRASLPF